MRFVFTTLLLFSLRANAVVGGQPIDVQEFRHQIVAGALGYWRVPIGPRVMLGCYHCELSGAHPPETESMQEAFSKATDDRLNQPSAIIDASYIASLPGFYDTVITVLPEGTPDYLPPYANLTKDPLKKGDHLIFVDNGFNSCGVPNRNFAHFDVVGFTKDILTTLISGRGLGINGEPNSYTCIGDSGGLYFRALSDNSVDLVGTHSFGFYENSQQLPQPNNVDPFLAGGTNLTSPALQEWILKNVGDNKVCGLTLNCERRKWKW
jgi:hypothetical protein